MKHALLKKIVRNALLFILFFQHVNNSFAQCSPVGQHDFEFWFGVPQWTNGYNSPQRIHFTGAGATSSCYEIDMPADPTFVPITGTVTAGGSQIVDLTSFMAQIVVSPANSVVNKGLRIKIWGKMGAYYANERGNNYGTLPLRGPNALGTYFIVPGQNLYSQNTAGYPGSTSQFVITATEDNTQVTVTPSEAIVGHGANVPFTILLNKGQSYQAANTIFNGIHLAGSVITSNNLVVVSYIDDLIFTGGPADNGGDQILPVSKLGVDYIHIRTNLTVSESSFLTGTQNGTTVTIFDGTTTSTIVINKGETKKYTLVTGKNAAYIHATKPIGVYQLGGSGGELGSGVLTPLENCKGTDIIGFQYPATASTTFFNFIVPSGAEGNFVLNGNTSLITASDFLNVPGFPGWKYCRKNMTGTFSPGTTIIISNSVSKFFFYQNLFSNSGGGGGDFSNFSDFGNIIMFPIVVRDCMTDTITLNSRSTAYNASITGYSWTGPNGFTSTVPSPKIGNPGPADTGWYFISITGDNGCSIMDSVYVTLPLVNVSVSPMPSVACAGSSVLISSSSNTGAAIDSIRWTGPNGFTSSSESFTLSNITAADAGTYSCRYYDKYGCFKESSATITVNTGSTIPGFTIGGESHLGCDVSAVTLNATDYVPGLSYESFINYNATSLFASNDFDSITTGFYNQMPTNIGVTVQPNLSGLTGIALTTNNFGVKYKGFINIAAAGTYTFYLNSYDGSNLYLDGSLIVTNDGTHALTEVSSAAITLTAGYHAIEINYFTGSNAANAALTVSYAGPSIVKTAIPASILYGPGGPPPTGITYSWFDAVSGLQIGTGSSLSVNTPGKYRLRAFNGCESFSNYEVTYVKSFDYGDLPSPWPVALAGISGCPTAGGTPTSNNDIWAGLGASTELSTGVNVNSDNYDDGLTNPSSLLIGGTTSTFNILLNSNTAGKTIFYGLWFDWNNNGDFTDDYEQPGGNHSFYSGSGQVSSAGVPAIQNVSVLVPASGSSVSYKTRLIVSDRAITFTDYDDIFISGEVEDYSQAVPLPVIIKEFTAEKVKEGTTLNWIVGTEINTSHYIIEWSTDGKNFSTIGHKEAEKAAIYSFLHTAPTVGMNYYRIKILDSDGLSAYSEVRAINVGEKNSQISISPNPLRANDILKIIINSSLDSKISVLVNDQIGNKVLQSDLQVSEGSNEIVLKIDNLAPGIYYLHLLSFDSSLNSLPVQKIFILK
jgi:hypothetical protein